MNDAAMNPAPLPRGASQERADISERYALTEPVKPPTKKKRAVRPRQDVVASLIGKVEPGGSYIICYDENRPLRYVMNTMRALHRFGQMFDPPVTVFLLPWQSPLFDLTAGDPATAPALVAPEAKTQTTLTKVDKYYPPAG